MALTCPNNVDTFHVILSSLLVLGIFISYVPQHIRIIYRRSSLGYSPLFLLLGALGAIANMFNVLSMQFSVFVCCGEQSSLLCFASLLAIFQFIAGFLMFFGLFLLYMYYYPKDRRASIEWRNSRIVFYFIMGALISTALVYAVVMTTFGYQSHAVVIFAYFLGYFACIVALFQYLPQIYKTWRTQSIGSLSIVSMCIQTPGALLIVYTQIQQPHSDYTTWLPTFAAAVLQGILLMMCLFLQYYCPRSSHPLEEMASFDDYDNGKNSETSAFEGKLPLVSNIDSQKSSSSELNAASTEDPYKLEVKPLIRSHKSASSNVTKMFTEIEVL